MGPQDLVRACWACLLQRLWAPAAHRSVLRVQLSATSAAFVLAAHTGLTQASTLVHMCTPVMHRSLPAVTNVAFVLVVFMYLWAIVGMNLWGNVKLTDSEAGNNRHRNFRHFPVTMISLFT